MNPWHLLGLTQDASPEEIRKAFRKRALEAHPDKKGGNGELMAQLNSAYEMLNNPELLKKWENSAEGVEDALNEEEKADADVPHLRGDSVPFSAVFRRRFEMFTEHFSVPREIDPDGFEQIFNDLNPNMQAESARNIWVSEDGTRHATLYDFVRHQSAWAADPEPLPGELYADMAPESAFAILRNFLGGKIYAGNLEIIKKHLSLTVKCLETFRKPEAALYGMVSNIINPSCLESPLSPEIGKTMAESISSIHEYARVHDLENNREYLKLVQDRHFRRVMTDSLWSFWKSNETLVSREKLHALGSQRHLNLKATPMIKTLWRFEKAFLHAFEENTSLDEIYSAAWTQIDLIAACNSMTSRANTILLAGMCLQYAATREEDPRRAAAAERIALQMYQLGLETSAYASPLIQLYIAGNIVKCLREFRYAHVQRMTLTDILRDAIESGFNPGDAALNIMDISWLETLQKAVRRTLYLADLVPVIRQPGSSIDIIFHELIYLSVLRNMLLNALDEADFSESEEFKIRYHAYEAALQGWIDGNRRDELHEGAVSAFMREMGGSVEQNLDSALDFPNTLIKRDAEGWLAPESELDFPEMPDMEIFSSFDGVEVDLEAGTIDPLYSRWRKDDPRYQRLFILQDVDQLMKKGIDDITFSLDHADSSKEFHPLQKKRYTPERLVKTGYLEAAFWTDYLLKFLVSGAEVRGRAPYDTRSMSHLYNVIEGLPAHLREIFELSQRASKGHRVRRFWLELGELEVVRTVKNGVLRLVFGNMPVRIKTRLMTKNANDELVDSELADHDDHSPEAEFAAKFTEHYDEIGQYFPEFLRLKELAKAAAAVKFLKEVRKGNTYEQRYHQNFLSLQDTVSHFPKFSWQLNDPDLHKLYDTQLSKWMTEHKEFVDQNNRFQTQYRNLLSLADQISNDLAIIPGQLVQEGQRLADQHTKLAQQQAEIARINRDYAHLFGTAEVKNALAILSGNVSVLTQNIGVLERNIQILTANKATLEKQQRELPGHTESARQLSVQTADILGTHQAQKPTLESIQAILNQEGKKQKTLIHKHHMDLFADLPAGNAEFASPVEALLNGDPDPLATAMAEAGLAFQAQAEKAMRLEAAFKGREFDSIDDAMSHSDPADLYAPSMMYVNEHSSRRVYGGYLGISKELKVMQLSNGLGSYMLPEKESSIREANSFIREESRKLNWAGILFGDARRKLDQLGREVQQAEWDLWRQKLEDQSRNQFMHGVGSNRTPHSFSFEKGLHGFSSAPFAYSGRPAEEKSQEPPRFKSDSSSLNRRWFSSTQTLFEKGRQLTEPDSQGFFAMSRFNQALDSHLGELKTFNERREATNRQITMYYFSRPLQDAPSLATISDKARHAGFFLNVPDQGMFRIEVQANDMNVLGRAPMSIYLTKVDATKALTVDNYWVQKVGQVKINISDVESKMAEWVGQNPDYWLLGTNCQKFVADFVKQLVKEGGLQPDSSIDNEALLQGNLIEMLNEMGKNSRQPASSKKGGTGIFGLFGKETFSSQQSSAPAGSFQNRR